MLWNMHMKHPTRTLLNGKETRVTKIIRTPYIVSTLANAILGGEWGLVVLVGVYFNDYFYFAFFAYICVCESKREE